jgi:GT2 family glycosyltransferase
LSLRLAAVVPNWNGRDWLPGCLGSLFAQSQPPAEVLVVDNGSTDGSRELLAERYSGVRVLPLPENRGFAAAANAGLAAATEADAVALINTDVELEPDWLERLAAVLRADPGLAAVSCRMVELDRPELLYDAGDVLRRDGVCEQRGRFEAAAGRFELPGEVFGACAGAALYRRSAVLAAGGFDERLFAYMEDVDLAVRLRLAGWRCAYEPAVARHAGGGSSDQLRRPVTAWAERNTLLLVAKHFPARWLGPVLYRQLGWAWHAARERRLRSHLGGVMAALPQLPAMRRERRRLRASAVVPIGVVVPRRRIRRARS